MTPRNRFLLAIPAIVVVLWSATGWPQAGTARSADITVIGLGAVFANDVAAARDKAIDDAMRKAVQQALGTQIKSETLVKNFQLVEDQILAWSSGYVNKYDILREGLGKYDTYEVEMRAQVNLSELRNDDNALAELLQKENPRVMVLIAEQNIGEAAPIHYFEVDMTAAETAIIDLFRTKGFEVVDPTQAKANQENDALMSAINGDARQAAIIASANQAELVVTGKAVATVASGMNLGGMKSCQANLTARVVRASDARILATATEHAAVPHIDEVTGGTMAIDKAAKKGGETLVAKVAAEAQKSFYNENTISLRVQGHQNVGELQQFSSVIKQSLRGVKNLYERQAAAGYAMLEIKILGNASQLSRELANKDLSPFAVEVVNVAGNRVDVKIAQAAQDVEEQEEVSAEPDSIN